MPSEYRKVREDLWLNPDFVALTPMAQWLYLALLTSPGLSYAGVKDWHEKRFLKRAGTLTLSMLHEMSDELEEARFILLDKETDEVMIRTFVKHDELLRNPNFAVASLKSFKQIASPKLRAAFITEMHHLQKQQPKLPGWKVMSQVYDYESSKAEGISGGESYECHPETYPE